MLRVIGSSSDVLSTDASVEAASVVVSVVSAAVSVLVSVVALPVSAVVAGAEELPQAARERVITPANSVETNFFIFITPLLC